MSKRLSSLALGLSLLAGPALATNTSLDTAINSSKILADFRLRYERVHQDGFADRANALTYRIRAGFVTGELYDTQFLIDFEHIGDIAGDFNSTLNGKTGYPVVPDPNATELNRIQLMNTSLPDTKLIFGRQRIKLDNVRFVGNVGWRQNEQTFDAIRVINKSVEGLTLDVSYLDQINRIFGDDSPMGRFESDSWLINAKAKLPVDFVDASLTGFAYLLDFDNAAALSSQTYGFLVTAKKDGFTLSGSYAHQSDFGNQPTGYSVNYAMVEGQYAYKGASIGAGYEMLGGDGTKAFTTPLATLHKFNGFADVFLGTPAAGLDDVYLKAAYVIKKAGWLDLIKVAGAYHFFSAEETSADYGDEFDAVLVLKKGRFGLISKYAIYETDGFATDRNKFWIEFTISLSGK